MTTFSFNPDPATADAILQSIAAEYSLSLTDIANQHNTTIEALTAWLTREDIDERLTAIESACARRARLTAANHLPAVAHVAKQALEEASDVLRLPPDYRTQRSIALRIRATESARKAAALLLRIANFTPGPRRIRQHDAPATPRVLPPLAPAAAAPAESTPPCRPTRFAPSAHTAPTSQSSADSSPRAPSFALAAENSLSEHASLPFTESETSAPTSVLPADIAEPFAPTAAPSVESTPTEQASPGIFLVSEPTPDPRAVSPPFIAAASCMDRFSEPSTRHTVQNPCAAKETMQTGDAYEPGAVTEYCY